VIKLGGTSEPAAPSERTRPWPRPGVAPWGVALRGPAGAVGPGRHRRARGGGARPPRGLRHRSPLL